MKRILLTGLVISILIMGIQLSYNVDSFPGFHSNGDCNLCHNYPATAYNDTFETYNLGLDGLPDDAIWDDHSTYGRRSLIPVGSSFGSSLVFISLYFGQNSTHFFMMASWEDAPIEGTDTMHYSAADGLSFLFNINRTDFDTGYGMDLAPGNTAVDIFTWKPAASATGTQTSQDNFVPIAIESNMDDQYIFDDSRHDDDTNEWAWAATHGNISLHSQHNYNVEFVRPLVTADPNDVQFDRSKYYEFGLALYNNSAAASHMISPAYSVFVWNPNDTGGVETITTVQTQVVTSVETTIETQISTQVETEGKEPLALVPIFIALIAIPVFLINRRRT